MEFSGFLKVNGFDSIKKFLSAKNTKIVDSSSGELGFLIEADFKKSDC